MDASYFFCGIMKEVGAKAYAQDRPGGDRCTEVSLQREENKKQSKKGNRNTSGGYGPGV